MIDRLAPTQRPDGPNAGTQRWQDLLFVHFEVDPAQLRALVPQELELDLWEGRALVGLVPFAMRSVRPWWLPALLAQDFLEANVRTYVVRNGEPGVFFFSLEASSFSAVQAARIGWGLPYHYAAMSMTATTGGFNYTSRRRSDGARLNVEWNVGEPIGPSKVGSLEFFLLERYLLFTASNGRVRRGQVYHTPYPAHGATLTRLESTLLQATGLEPLSPDPFAVHASPGVSVEMFALTDA